MDILLTLKKIHLCMYVCMYVCIYIYMYIVLLVCTIFSCVGAGVGSTFFSLSLSWGKVLRKVSNTMLTYAFSLFVDT